MTRKTRGVEIGTSAPVIDNLARIVAETSAAATNSGVSFTDVIARAFPRLVLVERDDYDILRQAAEDAEDLAAAEAARKRDGEYFPAEMVDRLIDGGNPVKVWRQHRSMTQEALAAAAGITKGFISHLESGKKKASVKTLKALARALDCDLDDLA